MATYGKTGIVNLLNGLPPSSGIPQGDEAIAFARELIVNGEATRECILSSLEARLTPTDSFEMYKSLALKGPGDLGLEAYGEEENAIIQEGINRGRTEAEMRELVDLDADKQYKLEWETVHRIYLMTLRALVEAGDDGAVVEHIRNAAVDAGQTHGMTQNNLKLHIWRSCEFLEKKGKAVQVGHKLDKQYVLTA